MTYKRIVLSMGVAAVTALTTIPTTAQEVTCPQPWHFRYENNSARGFISPPSLHDPLLLASVLSSARFQTKTALLDIEKFLRKSPTAAEREELNLSRATIYLNRGDFNRAHYYLNLVDERALSGDAIAEWKVKLAYALLKTKRQTGNLADLFADAAKSKGYWGQVASLYVAGELLAQGKTKQARSVYKTLELNPIMQMEAQIGEIACYYYEGNNKQALQYTKELLARYPEAASNPTFLQTSANAAYREGDVALAAKLFPQLFSLYPDQPTDEDRVVYAATLIEKNQYPQAIKILRPATEGNGLTAQVAALYLSRALREDKRYPEAIAFYESITTPKTPASIREIAMYEMALVMRSSGQSNFGQDVRIAEDFLNTFPHSRHRPTMEHFLTEFYFSNTNYAYSLKSIVRVKDKTEPIREAEQYVLNALARQAIDKELLPEAKQYLIRALAAPHPSSLYFGESLLIQADYYEKAGDIAAAIASLKSFINRQESLLSPNYQESLYRLGYLYFNNREFVPAADFFTRYLQHSSIKAPRKCDAYARLGDCQLANQSLNEALVSYSIAMDFAGQTYPYPYIKKAEILGLQKKYSEQIATLEMLIAKFPNRQYHRLALLQIGDAYLQAGNKNAGEQSFLQTAEKFPQSEEGRKALLRLALLYYNTGRSDAAIAEYKKIITTAPSSAEARQAFDNIKTICIEEGKPEILNTFASENSPYKLSDQEGRELAFTIAQNAFRKRSSDAEKLLADFIKKYRTGSDVISARFMIASLQMRSGKSLQAYEHYKMIERSATEISAKQKCILYLKMGAMEYDENNYRDALRHYKLAYQEAIERDDKITAAVGTCRASLALNQSADGIDFATQALQELGDNATERIRLLRGYLYTQAEKDTEALADYRSAAKNTDAPVGAEAVVAEAYAYLYNTKEPAKARKLLNKFIEKGSSQEYWLARAIILLAEVYAEEGDAITAKQYLNSLATNYPKSNDDIVERIEIGLKKIKLKEEKHTEQ